MMLPLGLFAQPQGDRPAPPEMKSPEEIAKEKVDQMQAEIDLSEDQYKQVYKLFKKDQEYRRSQMESAFSGGMPPMGGGMPFGQGGGPGGDMGGGMPPMGGGSGMGTPPSGDQGMRPSGPPPGMNGEGMVSEKYIEKQDQKLKKILTEEQYSQWRSKHPLESTELPEIVPQNN